jgi:hypothetical protein
MTTFDYSSNICMKYQMKVRGLSGNGMQIMPSIDDPDRSCRVACQDKFIAHRFYLVNGEQGFFPFGINCSFKSGEDNRYCVNGRCLKFGADDTPVSGVFYNNFNVGRSKRSLARSRRHFTYFPIQNYTEHVSKEYLNRLVKSVDLKADRFRTFNEIDADAEHIDLNRPIDFHGN